MRINDKRRIIQVYVAEPIETILFGQKIYVCGYPSCEKQLTNQQTILTHSYYCSFNPNVIDFNETLEYILDGKLSKCKICAKTLRDVRKHLKSRHTSKFEEMMNNLKSKHEANFLKLRDIFKT